MKRMFTKKIIYYYIFFVVVLGFSFSCHQPKVFQTKSQNPTTAVRNNQKAEMLVSCEEVECPPNVTAESPVYNENGDCLCFCNFPYEGHNCDKAIRERVTGLEGQTYEGFDTCQSGTYDFSVTIMPSQEGTQYFTIQNFGGFDFQSADVRCEIIGVNEKGNIQFVVPIHKDVDSDGTRLIHSYQTADTFNSIGSIDSVTGVLTIGWQVIFFDQETDDCELVLTPVGRSI